MKRPPVRVHCRNCHRDSYADDVTVVSTIHHNQPGAFTATDQWRATCRHCGRINLTDCRAETAELLAETGFPHQWIDCTAVEACPDCGPLTDDHVIDIIRGFRELDTDAIWAQLDRWLPDTDAGIIQWGDDE